MNCNEMKAKMRTHVQILGSSRPGLNPVGSIDKDQVRELCPAQYVDLVDKKSLYWNTHTQTQAHTRRDLQEKTAES